MRMDYRLKKRVRLADLIDGRLENSGVWEQFIPGSTSDDAKCLSNGEDHLWAYADRDGFVDSLTVYGSPDNGSILAAIERTFGTEIFSENALEYWGYHTLVPPSEQAGVDCRDPASDPGKVDPSADLAREAKKFGGEVQGSAEPVR
jgi:hypothetical protein